MAQWAPIPFVSLVSSLPARGRSTRHILSSRNTRKPLKSKSRERLYPARRALQILSLAFHSEAPEIRSSEMTAAPSQRPRQSHLEILREFELRRNETFIAHRRGYRMERSTYGEILDDARRFARELESRGIAKPDAVLLWGAPSPAWIAAFFGCVLRGALAVPIDQVSTPEFASRVAREVGAKLVVRSRNSAAIAPETPSLELDLLLETIAHHSSAAYPSPALTRDDTLEIIFTSGTTAEPRGVVISHGNVLANIEPLEREIHKYLRYERFVHPLRFLNLLPLSHIFGQMMGIFFPPLFGGTVIVKDSV